MKDNHPLVALRRKRISRCPIICQLTDSLIIKTYLEEVIGSVRLAIDTGRWVLIQRVFYYWKDLKTATIVRTIRTHYTILMVRTTATCPLCGVTFSSGYNHSAQCKLHCHMGSYRRRIHPQHSSRCETCGRAFYDCGTVGCRKSAADKLCQHLKDSCHFQKSYICSCGKVFHDCEGNRFMSGRRRLCQHARDTCHCVS